MGHIYAVFAVLLGMTVFALDSLKEGIRWISRMFGSTGAFFGADAFWMLSNYGVLLVLCIFGALGMGKRLGKYPVVWVLVFVLSIAYLADASYNPFLYFRF